MLQWIEREMYCISVSRQSHMRCLSSSRGYTTISCKILGFSLDFCWYVFDGNITESCNKTAL